MPALFRLALTTVAVKSLFTNFPHSPLGKLAVAHEYQGKGIARALVEQVELLAQELAVELVELETRVELRENQRLFTYLGYRKTAENSHAGYSRPTSYLYNKKIAIDC